MNLVKILSLIMVFFVPVLGRTQVVHTVFERERLGSSRSFISKTLSTQVQKGSVGRFSVNVDRLPVSMRLEVFQGPHRLLSWEPGNQASTEPIAIFVDGSRVRIRVTALNEPRTPFTLRLVTLCIEGEDRTEAGVAEAESTSEVKKFQWDGFHPEASSDELTVLSTLSYWGEVLGEPSLIKSLVALREPLWAGPTRNWTLLALSAGRYVGIEAYVSRFRGLNDLAEWLESGGPAIVRLRGDAWETAAVVTGLTENSVRVVLPREGKMVAVEWPREQFMRQWTGGNRAVMLIHPSTLPTPPNPGAPWRVITPDG
jgi:hypothetical protein